MTLTALQQALVALDIVIQDSGAVDAELMAVNQVSLLEEPGKFLSGEEYYLTAGFSRVCWVGGHLSIYYTVEPLGKLDIASQSSVRAKDSWKTERTQQAVQVVNEVVYALLEVGAWKAYHPDAIEEKFGLDLGEFKRYLIGNDQES